MLGLMLVQRFQFTHPVWGATERWGAITMDRYWFQFTHPVWGATIFALC